MSDIKSALSEVEKTLELIDPELREWNVKYFNTHRTRYMNDLSVIKKHYNEKSGPILEIGALPCHITLVLKKLGFKIEGIDIDPSRSSSFIKKHKLKVKKCDIEKEPIPYKDNSVNFIIFNEIFEHLRINPIDTLKEINRVLKPGGTLMLSTPNLYSFYTIARFNLGKGINNPYKEFDKLNTLGHMGHVREYSTKEVKEFLHNSGFKVHDVEYSSYGKVNKPVIGPIASGVLKVIPKINLFQIIISKKLPENA